MTLLVVIAAASEAIALWCVVNLWRGRASKIRKMVWTLILLFPVVGPVFYGGMFEPPSVQPEGLSQEMNGTTSGPIAGLVWSVCLVGLRMRNHYVKLLK